MIELDNDKRTLSSTTSMKKSLEAIRNGEAGLTERRRKLLNRVPNSNDWASFERDSISIKDIAYLSAATHHEFALLRGKASDILLHGVELHCNFDEELLELLMSRKMRLIAHSHPDYDFIEASYDDRLFLRYIGQKESTIVSYVTGIEKKFKANAFEEI